MSAEFVVASSSKTSVMVVESAWLQLEYLAEPKRKELVSPGGIVDFDQIVQVIDAEIERLQHARAVLTGTATKHTVLRSKTTTGQAATTSAKPANRKRRLSAEGRKRIADAMRKRWAERKKAQGSGKQQSTK